VIGTERTSAAGTRPRLPGRIELARVIVIAEAPLLLIIAANYLTQRSFAFAALTTAGAGLLLLGGLRIGHDTDADTQAPVVREGRVPWDWTDFIIFWPGAFTAATLLISISVPLVDAFIGGVDPAVRTAAESFVAQVAYYAGALFNIWVLVALRRGGTLQDLGWRRFRWWWIPLAVLGAFATLQLAAYLQLLAQDILPPNTVNGQCVQVRHDYSHFVALAVVVVCVIAPLAEETIFRGFVYGWLQRVAPVYVAILVSAAIFSAVHGELLLYIPLFGVGCALALFYQGSRSLWPGALVHSLFNLPGIIAILTATSCS